MLKAIYGVSRRRHRRMPSHRIKSDLVSHFRDSTGPRGVANTRWQLGSPASRCMSLGHEAYRGRPGLGRRRPRKFLPNGSRVSGATATNCPGLPAADQSTRKASLRLFAQPFRVIAGWLKCAAGRASSVPWGLTSQKAPSPYATPARGGRGLLRWPAGGFRARIKGGSSAACCQFARRMPCCQMS